MAHDGRQDATPRLGPGQVLALTLEIERAIGLADLGLRALWDSTGRRFLHLQLLSQGLEHLLKLTLVLSSRPMPTSGDLRRFGHDLVQLSEAVVEVVRADPVFASTPAVQVDLEFLSGDGDVRRLLGILSEFGTKGRYHDLEMLLGAGPTPSPEDEWHRFESDMFRRRADWLEVLTDSGSATEVTELIAAELTSILQRFLRALCRMWTLGPAQALGTSYVGVLGRFLYLSDEQLDVPRHPVRTR